MSIDYPEEYIEQIFYLYYENSRKVGDVFISKIPDTSDGKKPRKETVLNWVKTRGWVERADALDAEASMKMDEKVIQRRMAMFKKHEEVGTELMEKGLEYLKENGISTDAAAIRAIDLGITTRVASTGMAEVFIKISKMPNDALNAELQKLLGKKEEIIDGDMEVIDEEE